MSEKAQKWHRLSRKLILDETVPQAWHDEARAAFVRGDAAEFTQLAKYGTLAVVVDNDEALRERGIYESAVVNGYVWTKHDHSDWDFDDIKSLFDGGNREKMRTAGSPLKGSGPFTVYRGVNGSGVERRDCGISWTDSLEVACWFATKFGGEAAAVNSASLRLQDIYCYYTGRNEDEYLGIPISWERLPLTLEEIDRYDAAYRAKQKARSSLE